MDKKIVSEILLTLLLISMLTLAFNIQPVRASGAIYIRPDGSVEGTDKIEQDGDVYTFTDDIYVPPSFRDAIVVERSNIIVDGNGHTLQGGSGYPTYLTRGFDLTARSIYPQPLSNVTIQNTNISSFDTGVSIWGGSFIWYGNHTISRNNITNNNCGIALTLNSYTNISENNITNNNKGIVGDIMGWYNIISGNNIINNAQEGIGFEEWPSYDCLEETCYLYNISRNNIVANGGRGISLVYGCGSNIISGNNITNNNGGIYIYDAWDNTISGNNITANNEYGISIIAYSWDTPSNIIFGNIIASHNYGIYMKGNFYEEFWIIDAGDNTISGNNITDNWDGVFLGSWCTNNIVSGNNITNNKRRGIYVSASEHNNICGNNITNNGSGIYLTSASRNSISGNNITNNGRGICGDVGVHRNIISGNNITNNDNDGIYFEDGFWNNTISRNSITANNGRGIGIVYFCGLNNICGNNITNNNGGIHIYANRNTTISGNNITANSEYGINLTTHDLDTFFNIISGNIIAGHNYGIYLKGGRMDGQVYGRTRDNTILGNNITDNYSGVELYDASDNTFFHNNFIGNTQQVHDVSWETPGVSPSVNAWDDGFPSGGNFWDDYSSRYPGAQELDGSGMWDTPYVIDGSNQDNYPLMEPWTPVVVDVVASDPDGSFTVVINAGADKGAPVTSWTVISACNILSYDVDLSLDGMTITITGQLHNPNLEGQIVIDVDPEGQIITYEINITPYVAPATVESCDSGGVKKDTFDIPDEVHVTGNGYSTSTTYDIYVVEDVVTWMDGMSIPSRAPGTAASVSSDAIGSIPPTLVWSPPLVLGRYDIVVDVNGNGVYDEGIDALDDSDIEVTAGFLVIPEVPFGTAMTLLGMIFALVGFLGLKRFHSKSNCR